MNIQHRRQPYLITLCAIGMLATAGVVGYIMTHVRESSPTPSTHHKTSKTKTSSKATAFNKSLYSTTEPGSIWWIVNKQHPAGETYVPMSLTKPNVTLNASKSDQENSIREDISPHVEELFNAAQHQGYELLFASGYRSFQLQSTYYSNYVKTSGQAEADRYSARPGTSEHQTGLAFDVSRADRQHYLEQSFSDDPEAQWLAANAHLYGFIIRYPRDKESVTGYMYEPWHLRYVGIELASELYAKKYTMEEFFGIVQ